MLLFEGEERDGIIGIGTEKNLYMQRVALVASLETFLIFFFFLRLNSSQKAWLENPIAFKTRTTWQQAFISSCLLFFRAYLSNKYIRYRVNRVAKKLRFDRATSFHTFFPPSFFQSEWDARRCSIVITIITLKNGT